MVSVNYYHTGEYTETNCVLTYGDTSVTQLEPNYVRISGNAENTVVVRLHRVNIYSTYTRDERDALKEQHRREVAFVRQFSGHPAPIVPRFNPPRFWRRPEFHARSRPRPASMRPRKPTRKERENAHKRSV